MQLIFNRQVAEQLGETYTILELEEVTKDGITLEVFCVIPVEKIGLTELSKLEHNKHLHNEFMSAYKRGEYKVCTDLYEHVRDNFSGEVSTFYDEIIRRITSTET